MSVIMFQNGFRVILRVHFGVILENVYNISNI